MSYVLQPNGHVAICETADDLRQAIIDSNEHQGRPGYALLKACLRPDFDKACEVLEQRVMDQFGNHLLKALAKGFGSMFFPLLGVGAAIDVGKAIMAVRNQPDITPLYKTPEGPFHYMARWRKEREWRHVHDWHYCTGGTVFAKIPQRPIYSILKP